MMWLVEVRDPPRPGVNYRMLMMLLIKFRESYIFRLL